MYAQTLRALMEQAGYSQVELAHKAGISQAVISRILNGERAGMHLSTGIALADVFGLADVRDLARPPQTAKPSQTQ
jgi:transcriptional regulator with XRE-family HTH domain